MIRRIPAADRHFTDAEWLKTFWLFSFSDYYDPDNIRHGALRVFNDDIVQPRTGFPDHPHRNYEIVTIILSGELTHWDSAGNRGTIKKGDVQLMSAGSGVMHSEFNYGEDPVHLYQLWIRPREEELEPSYGQRHFELDESNRFVKLVGPQGGECLKIHSDASLYHGNFAPGRDLTYDTAPDRKVFVYVTQGAMRLNGELFSAGDQARIEEESALRLEAVASSRFVLIDVPEI